MHVVNVVVVVAAAVILTYLLLFSAPAAKRWQAVTLCMMYICMYVCAFRSVRVFIYTYALDIPLAYETWNMKGE